MSLNLTGHTSKEVESEFESEWKKGEFIELQFEKIQ